MPPRTVKTPISRLPDDDLGFLRLPTVLALYPISAASWWHGVAAGRYPRPVKLSTRVSAWRVSDIRRLLASVTDTPSNDGHRESAG